MVSLPVGDGSLNLTLPEDQTNKHSSSIEISALIGESQEARDIEQQQGHIATTTRKEKQQKNKSKLVEKRSSLLIESENYSPNLASEKSSSVRLKTLPLKRYIF